MCRSYLFLYVLKLYLCTTGIDWKSNLIQFIRWIFVYKVKYPDQNLCICKRWDQNGMIKTHHRIVIPGKHGRNVPVILNDFIQEELQCLLRHWCQCVEEPNPYMFAVLRAAGSFIRGTDVLRNLSLHTWTQDLLRFTTVVQYEPVIGFSIPPTVSFLAH